jgi:hypothetical protein
VNAPSKKLPVHIEREARMILDGAARRLLRARREAEVAEQKRRSNKLQPKAP